MADAATFDSEMRFRCPTGLLALVDRAASRRLQKASEYARQAVLSALRADGLDPEQQQQYVLVAAGELVQGPHGAITTFNPSDDTAPHIGANWLPIENEDSAPFDHAQHWRMRPLSLRVDGRRVVRTYPIVVKSMEHT